MGGITMEDTIVAEPRKVHGWSTRLIDRISGATEAKDETQRRRVRILFLLLAAVTPLLVFAGNSGQTIFGDDQLQLWSGVIVGVALVLFAISRFFNAEKTIGVLLGFWALAVIAHGPLFYGDPTQISLTTLVLVPLIMGSVSGASASLLGTISVVLTYVAVLTSAYFQKTGISEAAIALLSYSTLSTILCGVLVSHFQKHTEAESMRLIRDNAKVREIALTDSLTRCHNRRAFQIAVDELSSEASRTAKPALFIMDLDRFKQINDTFGHDVGDEVLRAFSDRLQTAITKDASVFRLGGDEFAILLPDEPSQVALEGVARRIIDLCEDSIPTAAGDVDFDVSIGIALSDGSDIANEQLYRQADTAAFASKKRAGSSYLVFNTQIDGQITRQYEVEECLKVAIAKRSIDIAFQPQYDLRGGAIVSYEALARWRDPLLGKVSPAEFIQIAEKTRLVEVLYRQILSISLRNAQTWLGRQQKVSVNVSARTLKSQDFADYVLKHVRRNQLYPD
jgi:diguanylate cyclase (GGDEF)-like protein